MQSQATAAQAAPSQAQAAPAGEAPKRGIWAIMRPVRPRINTAMVMAALGSMAGLTAIASLAMVISALQRQDASLWWWILLSAGLTVASFFLRVQSFTVSHLAAFRLETELRSNLAGHLATIPLGHLLLNGTGSITKVIQEDVKSLHAFVADTTPFIGRSVATPVVTLVLLLIVDWRLALAALSVLVLGALAVRLAMRDHVEMQRMYDGERERINNAVVEFVQAMPVVRTFDDGASSFGRYQSALEGFRTALIRWMQASATSSRISIVTLAPLPTLLALTLAGMLLYQQGTLEFSSWVATLLLGTGMAESLMPLMWLHSFIRKANASAYRIQDLMEVPELPVPQDSLVPRDASVRFDNVCFAYEERSGDALKGVSFVVPAGTVTALVGPSGAGKSTVARLIPRFWDVRTGSVRIGGVDIRDMRPEVLMGNVAFVFQDTFLFHDTLAANIRLGRPEASMAEVERAARAAQAHAFISELPRSYETVAGERGTRLSGGQRQRITIARAILQDCPVVVLDEATAFADPENESALIAALANLMRGRTVIIIAHRLSTIRGTDQIVVLDQGRVSECGRHDDLLTRDGVYARLWRNYEQAQGWTLGQREQTGRAS